LANGEQLSIDLFGAEILAVQNISYCGMRIKIVRLICKPRRFVNKTSEGDLPPNALRG